MQRPASSGVLRRPARDQARGQQQLQQMVRILVHGETVEGDEGKRMALQGPVEQAQMYAVCMQELSLLVSSHSPTLADLCGTLWHGFVGLFRKSLAGEEAQLAREVEAHRRCSRQLRHAQEDAGHFEAEAAALRERARELQFALEDQGRQLAKASTALWQERQTTERLRSLCEDAAGIRAPRDEGVATSSPGALLTADAQRLGALVDAAEAEEAQAGRMADNLRRFVRSVGQVDFVKRSDAAAQTSLRGSDVGSTDDPNALYLHTTVDADGNVFAADGTPLGKMRDDGMVVGPDGKVIGRMGPDGSIIAPGPNDVMYANTTVGADGMVYSADGTPLGLLRDDGLVVGADGKVVGRRNPDGSIMGLGPGDALYLNTKVVPVDTVLGADGKRIGTLRADGMVIGPDGKVIGRMG